MITADFKQNPTHSFLQNSDSTQSPCCKLVAEQTIITEPELKSLLFACDKLQDNSMNFSFETLQFTLPSLYLNVFEQLLSSRLILMI